MYRRRRLDGALNRVPMGFYAKIWKILETCQAIVIQGKVLGTQLTQEVSKLYFQIKVYVVNDSNSIEIYKKYQIKFFFRLSYF